MKRSQEGRKERNERGKRRSRPTGSLAALQFIAGDLGGIASASKSSISPPNNGSVVLLAIYPKRINSKRAVNIHRMDGRREGRERERERVLSNYRGKVEGARGVYANSRKDSVNLIESNGYIGTAES